MLLQAADGYFSTFFFTTHKAIHRARHQYGCDAAILGCVKKLLMSCLELRPHQNEIKLNSSARLDEASTLWCLTFAASSACFAACVLCSTGSLDRRLVVWFVDSRGFLGVCWCPCRLLEYSNLKYPYREFYLGRFLVLQLLGRSVGIYAISWCQQVPLHCAVTAELKLPRSIFLLAQQCQGSYQVGRRWPVRRHGCYLLASYEL